MLTWKIVAKQRSFYNTGATRPIPFRKEQLRKLFYLINDHTQELADALHSDLRKPLQEAMGAEIGMTIQDVLHVIKHVTPSPKMHAV